MERAALEAGSAQLVEGGAFTGGPTTVHGLSFIFEIKPILLAVLDPATSRKTHFLVWIQTKTRSAVLTRAMV